jgi:hypothetical protein
VLYLSLFLSCVRVRVRVCVCAHTHTWERKGRREERGELWKKTGFSGNGREDKRGMG